MIARYLHFLVVLAFLCQCGSETEVKPKPSGVPVSLIPGKWKIHMILTDELKKLKKKSIGDYYTLMAQLVDSSYMEFQTDSTFTGRFGPDLVGGHWELSADSRHIITTDLKGEKEVLKIIRLTKDSLNLLNLSYASGITLEMAR
ncbi:MAG: hypothetical protein ACHQF2_07550 [Flavobacteriales bacterium]